MLENAKEAHRKSDESLISLSLDNIRKTIEKGELISSFKVPKDRENVINKVKECLESYKYNVIMKENNTTITFVVQF